MLPISSRCDGQMTLWKGFNQLLLGAYPFPIWSLTKTYISRLPLHVLWVECYFSEVFLMGDVNDINTTSQLIPRLPSRSNWNLTSEMENPPCIRGDQAHSFLNACPHDLCVRCSHKFQDDGRVLAFSKNSIGIFVPSIGSLQVPLAGNRPSATSQPITEDPHQLRVVDAFSTVERTVDRWMRFLSKHLRASVKTNGISKMIGTGIDGAMGNWLEMTWSVPNASIRGKATQYFGSSETGRNNTPSAVRKSARIDRTQGGQSLQRIRRIEFDKVVQDFGLFQYAEMQRECGMCYMQWSRWKVLWLETKWDGSAIVKQRWEMI